MQKPPPEIANVYADMLAIAKKHGMVGFFLCWSTNKDLLTVADGAHEQVNAIEELCNLYTNHNAIEIERYDLPVNKTPLIQ
ncbi:hypothetical protein [Runella salmonicolor]|uniref:Uncharacterized protein n=1 Tax=Runella salmonicolor TaxID=2950278 RepID=A0ABT1FSX4_9BACT|nr:hypothetical protein [Runella salmonicolor]MCP1384867.1 hypothetical protein [Runella salmonicolor]